MGLIDIIEDQFLGCYKAHHDTNYYTLHPNYVASRYFVAGCDSLNFRGIYIAINTIIRPAESCPTEIQDGLELSGSVLN